MGECRQQKHTQHSPSVKTECDYLYGWIKKSHIRKNLTQKTMNFRDRAGDRAGKAEEEEEEGRHLGTRPAILILWSPEIELGRQKKKKADSLALGQRLWFCDLQR